MTQRIFNSITEAEAFATNRLTEAGWNSEDIALIVYVPDPYYPKHILWLGEAPLHEIADWANEHILWQHAKRVVSA